MIELPVLIENIIEIVNVAIEMMLVFLYFSLLSKAKVNKQFFICRIFFLL